MMDTKSEKSKRTLLLRDFVADEDGKFVFSEGDHDEEFRRRGSLVNSPF